MNREMLVKLLNLSTSPEDGEALNAIRHANRMLKKANLTWDEYVRKVPVTVAGKRKQEQRRSEQRERQRQWAEEQRRQQEAREAQRRDEEERQREREEEARNQKAEERKSDSDQDVTLEEVFGFLLHEEKVENSSSFSFIKSVHEYWVKHGRLSEKQKDILLVIYKRFLKKVKN